MSDSSSWVILAQCRFEFKLRLFSVTPILFLFVAAFRREENGIPIDDSR